MSKPKIPSRLGKEPLVDVIFELRFSSTAPVSKILPGILFTKLTSAEQPVSVNDLPIAQLPEAMRRSDPALQYAPLVALDWGQFSVLVGDSSICVGCKMPYPGWTALRTAILRVVNEVNAAGIVQSIDRYSMKYVDLIEKPDTGSQVSSLNWNVRVGSHSLEEGIATVRLEIKRDNIIHIVSIQTGVSVEIPGRGQKIGVVVDTDSICNVEKLDMADFLGEIESNLNDIHSANLEVFFDCLTPETIDYLEPEYD